ncbi:hypothetical protein BaRGS_00030394 [Batillaria attramentaria]|uniref:Uncharacterized protein n=1 Tax=Batillaria attramentaria TaxID=370345 RepID=A0ABD0JUN7_9CAEN
MWHVQLSYCRTTLTPRLMCSRSVYCQRASAWKRNLKHKVFLFCCLLAMASVQLVVGSPVAAAFSGGYGGARGILRGLADGKNDMARAALITTADK